MSFRMTKMWGQLSASLIAVAIVTGCENKSNDTQTATETTAANIPKNDPNAANPPLGLNPPDKPLPKAVGDWSSRLDADMKAVLDKLQALGGKPIETLSASDARKQPTPADAAMQVAKDQKKSAPELDEVKTQEKKINVNGGSIGVRIYTPKNAAKSLPVIAYFHGGGFVIATNDTYDASARALASGVNAIVVSTEYRKSPESKFPTAHDDAFAAYKWITQNAASFGGDPKKIAVVGESAGGNLAANVAIAARDSGQPVPLAEVLIYPVANADMSDASYIENAEAKPLNKAMMGWFTQQYFRTPADANDSRISLVNANLKGLPPTTIINAEIDPLRSEGELLASKMQQAGVKVEQRTYAGVTHEFFGMGLVVLKAKEAETMAIDALKTAFAK